MLEIIFIIIFIILIILIFIGLIGLGGDVLDLITDEKNSNFFRIILIAFFGILVVLTLVSILIGYNGIQKINSNTGGGTHISHNIK